MADVTSQSGHINPNDGWSRLAGERVLLSLFDTFRDTLKAKTPSQLQRMAEVLAENSSREFQESQVDPDEWIASFSGPNLRWESLGILFTYWSYGTFVVTDRGRTLFVGHSRKLMALYKKCAMDCVSLGSRAGQCNSLIIYTMFKSTIIESNVSGDASKHTSRSHPTRHLPEH